ncbi:hypothetical protein EJ04DRAFT_548290 [Polyplosphaeria fusca]|uniref:Uncharacterized protein n=1 Tax=Polyplosphaeria fusca TaxID=682080 RepID=A0A9P4RC06_9PLEO|nr:hypothetical protein EJ04DRAFT_548290 [Polyplosphaeria fusca]
MSDLAKGTRSYVHASKTSGLALSELERANNDAVLQTKASLKSYCASKILTSTLSPFQYRMTIERRTPLDKSGFLGTTTCASNPAAQFCLSYSFFRLRFNLQVQRSTKSKADGDHQSILILQYASRQGVVMIHHQRRQKQFTATPPNAISARSHVINQEQA